MADRTIIFSAPMIHALLDGRKTQTRRILGFGNSYFNGGSWPNWAKDASWSWGGAWVDPGPSPAGNTGPYLKLPYGGDSESDQWIGTVHRIYPKIQPGDRLWVREAWAPNEVPPGEPIYRADYGGCSACQTINLETGTLHSLVSRWRSPIHMPRWASRLTLTVTDVRVQRVQEISEADAKAEGLATVTKDGSLWKWGIPDRDGLPGNDDHGWHWRDWKADPREAFRDIWNSIHGPDAWAANPWVCALTFTVERRNIDAPTTDEATTKNRRP